MTQSRITKLAWMTIFILGALFTPSTRAAQIQGVNVSAFSGQYWSLNVSTPDRRSASNLVSSTGLFGDVLTTVPGGSMWLSATAGPVATNFLVFDLGGTYTVNGMKVWNYNATAANLSNDLRTASISYSTDGVNFTTNAPAQNFSLATGMLAANGQTIVFDSPVVASFIRIDGITNYATASASTGLGKVRFISNTNAPTLVAATENYGSNQVTVYFSESVDAASATNPANYAVQGATILSAALGNLNDRVILKTSPLTNQNYSVTASGVYDLALTAPITNNSTAPVQSEVVLWLQGNNGVQTDGGGNVTNWVDQSGYGHNALPFVVNQYSQTPTAQTSAVNGLTAVSFNGSQLLAVSNDANLAINGDVTVCLVIDKTSSAAGDPISKTGGQGNPYSGTPAHGYTNNMPGPFDYQINASQKSSWTWGNPGSGSTLGTLAAAGAFVINQYYIVTASVTGGTNFTWYLNGSANGSTTFPEAPADSGNPILLGLRADSGNTGDAGLTFTGNIAEAMVIRGTLTPSDLVGLNGYLGQKYNIPVTTLGITAQPESVTAQTGQTAAFGVGATGVPPLTYQWRSNNVAITGATNAVYTTAPVAASYNAASYTVVVTSPVGSATSTPPAVLTVIANGSGPTVSSVTKATNGTNLTVVFSQSVSSASALNAANYTINGAAPTAVAAGALPNEIVLTSATALSSTNLYVVGVQNVQDLSNNTMSSTNVLVFPANLSVWLRADAGVLTDSNGNVARWLDQSANANHASEFTNGDISRPTPAINQINGQPAVIFNAANSNFLQIASSPSTALTNDLSIFVVANLSDNNAPRELLGKTFGAIPASYDYYVWGARNETTFLRGNGVGYDTVNGGLPSANVPHVFGLTMASTSVNHYLDGAANGSGTINTNIADKGNALDIGGRNDLSQFMNGGIAEVLIFNQALASNDLALVNDYLGVKYFPFSFTAQPTGTNTQQGVSATFSVAATQGSATFAYQWLENSNAIPGATNATYTTPLLQPGDNGDVFSVQVIVPGYSTNVSAPATLTVTNALPVLLSSGIEIWNSNRIVLTFSEPVDPASATNPANYVLNPAATILSIALGSDSNTVVLTVSGLATNTAYSVNAQNVMDLYTNTMLPATTPVTVYPTAALWVMASQGVTSDANGVSEWDDLSGNGNNFLQSYGPPYEPMLVSNAANGWPAIQFNPTNETFMGAASSPTLQITGDMAIFAVVTYNSLTGNTNGMIVSKTENAQPAPFDYYTRPSAIQFYRGNGSVNGLVNSTRVPSLNTPHLLDVVMQGTSVLHRLDGNNNGAGTITAPIGDTGEAVYIGTRMDGLDRLNGSIAELIILNSAPTTNDVLAIENYLGSKYGLLVGLRPALAITQAAGNVTLSWVTPEAPFVLQSASSLTGAWLNVTNTPVISGPTSSVTLPVSGAQMFYRLQE